MRLKERRLQPGWRKEKIPFFLSHRTALTRGLGYVCRRCRGHGGGEEAVKENRRVSITKL